MARHYRRYKRRNEPMDDLWVLIILVVIALGWWQLQRGDGVTTVYLGIAVVLLVGLIAGLALWKYRQAQRKLRALDIAAIDTMDPLKFEIYVAKLLKHRGFTNVRITEKYDYGVDIIATKDGVTWGVQVKRYSNLVKAEAVRQVVPALIRYKCDRAMVVTNSTFSRPAMELAADNRCVLVDRDVLSEWIVEFQNNISSMLK